jgi:penicillin amidase
LLGWLPTCGYAQDLKNRDSLPNGARIARDALGIPHLSAKNERDLLFLQGYVHAQDRLFQMDVTRRQADGTLAELLGTAALASDVQLRTLGLRRAAERSLPLLSRATSDALAGYTDGVNAYVASNPLPPEYPALEITQFRPWTPADSIAVIKLISFGLSFDLTDLDRTTLLSQYQASGTAQGFNGSALFFDDINRLAPFNNAATVPDAGTPAPGRYDANNSSAALASVSATAATVVSQSPAMHDRVLMDLATEYLAHLRSLPFVQAAIRGPEDDRGSNQFAISGQRSRSGLPILANDPHLQLTAPAIFYQNQLSSPGFNVIGASLAGAPFVIVGHTDRIAWGLTTHFMDVTDVYQERIVSDPDSPSGLSTMYNGALEPVQALPQTFRANTAGDGVMDSLVTVPAGGSIPAAVLIVPRRNQGPIIVLNQAAGTAISVQYAGFSGTREIQAFRAINRANNLNQFRRAIQNFDVGSQNFLYADTAGNIAYYTSAEAPLREDLQAGAVDGLPPFLIRNGEGGNEWMPAEGVDPTRALPYAILPFDEMPQLVNPPRGLIVNANNDPSGNSRDNNTLNVLRPDGGIRYLGSGYNFDLGIRAGRIESLFAPFLASGRPLGAEDLRRFQSDVVMGDAQYFAPFIVRALANARRAGAPAELAGLAANARIAEAVGRFAAWDHSAPSGIFEGFDASDRNGVRAEPGRTEISNSIAATIYAVTRNQLLNQILVATLSRRGLPASSPRDAQLTALKNLFDNFSTRAGVGASGIDFFDVPGVASAADRRDILLLRCVSAALDLLASPAFADAFGGSANQADYRWGQLHRVVFAHPLGGSFNTPPAGGAFPQPLPNLPGIPTDGGLHTIDLGNHPVNRDNANGFMFGGGPSSRFVFTITPDGIEAVASLPGGESGVRGNPLNLNLLPGWLTNDTFPLRMDEKPRGNDGRDHDRDRDWKRD